MNVDMSFLYARQVITRMYLYIYSGNKRVNTKSWAVMYWLPASVKRGAPIRHSDGAHFYILIIFPGHPTCFFDMMLMYAEKFADDRTDRPTMSSPVCSHITATCAGCTAHMEQVSLVNVRISSVFQHNEGPSLFLFH